MPKIVFRWKGTLTRVVMTKTRAALADVQNVPDSDLNPKVEYPQNERSRPFAMIGSE